MNGYDEGAHGGTRPPITPLYEKRSVERIEFEVRGHPPSINDSYRVRMFRKRCPCGRAYFSGGGSALALKKPSKAWQRVIAMAAMTAKANAHAITILGPVRLIMEWTFRRDNRDVAGGGKMTEDALQGILFRNDRQVYERTERKQIGPNEGVRIIVERMPCQWRDADGKLCGGSDGIHRMGCPRMKPAVTFIRDPLGKERNP